MEINIIAAWLGFLLGCTAGAVMGLCFHKVEWAGGYTSWPRRMVRLAHIAFFGLGLLNLTFALTVRSLNLEGGVTCSSYLLLLGAVTMPLVCYLAAWRLPFRHLFFIPAGSVTIAIALLVWKLSVSFG